MHSHGQFLRALGMLSTLVFTGFSTSGCSDDDSDSMDSNGSGGSGGQATGTSGKGNDGCPGVELPQNQHFVAEGLCAGAVATEQGPLRQITFTSNGDLIGVTMSGEIRRYRDLDGDHTFLQDGEIVTLGETGGGNGNNAHVDEDSGYLYAGTPTGVARWIYSSETTELGEPEDVVVDQPSNGTHTLHTVHAYGGYLYVHSGSENNAVAPMSPEYDTNRAVLKRFDLSDFEPGAPFAWEDGEVVVLGIRNMVGFTRNAAGRMYGVINGLDDLMFDGNDVHLNNPGDDLIRIEPGTAHGYPYCFTAVNVTDENGDIVPAGTQLTSATRDSAADPDFANPNDQEWCDDNADEPETFLPAHSAPLDLTFFDAPSDNLPEAWRGGAFVALHGSWNTMPSVGHKVVFIPFDEDGNAEMPTATAEGTYFPFEVVFGGGNAAAASDGTWGWSNGEFGEDPVRPVGVAISPVDGALYVSSDNNSKVNQGALYRIARLRD